MNKLSNLLTGIGAEISTTLTVVGTVVKTETINSAKNYATMLNDKYNTHYSTDFILQYQAKFSGQMTLANSLVIIGIVGFVIVGVSLLGGYAIHKHVVTVSKKWTES
jgi:ABC-type glycerol-3-phosphate transport system permease component